MAKDKKQLQYEVDRLMSTVKSLSKLRVVVLHILSVSSQRCQTVRNTHWLNHKATLLVMSALTHTLVQSRHQLYNQEPGLTCVEQASINPAEIAMWLNCKAVFLVMLSLTLDLYK